MAVTVVLSAGTANATMTNGSAVVTPFVTSTATLTNGAVSIASPSSTTNWAINATVTGTGIPAGARLRYNGTAWELSAAYTGTTGTVTLTVTITNTMRAPQQLTLTNGSTAVGGTTTGLVQGCFVTGVGIADGTTAIFNGTTWVLSQAFTGTTGATWVTAESMASNPTNTAFAGLQQFGWQVGAVVQVTGLAAPTTIRSVICGVSATLSNTFTGTTGTQTPSVSSISGAIVTLTLSASGDSASPANLVASGFAQSGGPKIADFIGAVRVHLQIATGATYDDTEWAYNFGWAGGIRFNETYGCGTWRSGYINNSGTFVKAKGHTINYNNFLGNTGGSSLFFNTGAPPGFVGGTTMPTVQWNDTAWIAQSGSNNAASASATYSTFNCGRMVFDYAGDTGSNAGYGGSYGTIEALFMYRCIGGVSTGIDTTKLVTVGKFEYFSVPSTGTEVRFGFPNLIEFSGFAPLTYTIPATATNLACNTTAYEILVDPIYPAGLDFRANHKNFTNGQREYRRTVAFTLKDTTGAALTNTTLYIKSAAGTLVNAVQTGDFSQKVKSYYMAWAGNVGVYRIPSLFEDFSSQVAQFRKNGYVEQILPSYSLADAGYSQPVFLALDPAYGAVTPTAAASVTGVAPNYGSQLLELADSRNLDEVYGFTGHSLALTANSRYANFRGNSGGAFSLTSPWAMQIISGDLSMGAYNTKMTGSKPLTVSGSAVAHCTSGALWGTAGNTWYGNEVWGVYKTYTSDGSLTLGTEECVWTPSVYADMPTFKNGGTFNLPAGSHFTMRPTVSLGFSTNTMFGLNSKWNMTDSTIEFDMGSIDAYNGSFFSAFSSNNTCVVNFTNAVWTINGTGTGTMNPFTHLYWAPTSTISGWTINGTQAQNFTLNMSTSPIKLTGFSAPCILTGALSGSPTVPLDTYTYTGSLSAMKTTLGRQTYWSFLDAARSDGAVFRWDAGVTTPTGTDGYYAVLHFRPAISVAGTGYSPTVRLTPSALASRYPVKTFSTTADSTVALSNFYRDATMGAADGSLPFVDSLDSKTVQTIINWTLDLRKPGYLDAQKVFAGATAKKGLVTYTASGVVDSNYVNAATAAADALLISVNTSTKTIAAVTGTLFWSPQRLYNALKNWWATYASDVDFLSASSGGVLRLGDYNVAANIGFGAPAAGDAFAGVSTTGLINALVNDISVNDSRGTSTIWQFQSVAVGSSIAIWDELGATVYYQGNVATAGTYSKYLPAASSGTYSYAIERYGYRREGATFPATQGGILFYVPDYQEDVGIAQATLATVLAYTTLENPDKFYDRTAAFRLTEQGIKLGQIVAREGTALNIGSFNHVINHNASAVYSITGNVITTKSAVYEPGTKYIKEIATPPATITAHTNEIITVALEDANGNSQAVVAGTVNSLVDVWKITNATPVAYFATGTKIASNIGNGAYRFIAVDGYKLVFNNKDNGIYRYCSMSKGDYTVGWYLYDVPTGGLTQEQSDVLTGISTKTTDTFNDVNSLMTGFVESTDNLHALRVAVDTKPTLSQIEASSVLVKKTDTLNANIVQVNTVPVSGTGAEGDEWGPAP